jgi:hypothetical protein
MKRKKSLELSDFKEVREMKLREDQIQKRLDFSEAPR